MKEIFSYNVDINKNAYLNWRTSKNSPILNMIILAEGFMESSIILANEALYNNIDKKSDILIFPILFNANHSIELYLKAITWTLNILLNKDRKVEGNHDIKQIYNVLCSRFNEFEKDKDKKRIFKKLTINLKLYIDELYSKINDETEESQKDNMDFSRYPISKKYINHFYVDKFDNVVVDLENFIEKFSEIGKNLNNIANHYFYNYLESKYEE